MVLNSLLKGFFSVNFNITKYGVCLACLLFNVNTFVLAEPVKLPVSIKQKLLIGQFEQAATDLKKLSRKNNAVAQYQLALLYLSGKGVVKSQKKAITLLTASASGHSKAAYLLGTIYLKEEETKNEAVRFITMAADAGYLQAQKKLRVLKKSKNNQRIMPQTQALFALSLNAGKLSLLIQQYNKGANLNHINDKGYAPIITALNKGYNDIVEWLLKQNINLNVKDHQGNSLLHIMATKGKLNHIIQLSNFFKKLNLKNNHGDTAILLALQNNNKHTAQWLLNQGARISIMNKLGVSAESYAKNKGIKLVKRNKNNKKENNIQQRKINERLKNYALKQTLQLSKDKKSSYFDWPLLHIATAQKQLNIVKELLNKNHSPWEFNPNKQTAIELAISSGNQTLINRLLSQHSINTQTDEDKLESLLNYAVTTIETKLIKDLVSQSLSLGFIKMLNKVLVKTISSKNKKSSETLLSFKLLTIDKALFLSSFGLINESMMEKLIQKGANIEWRNASGQSSIILAAKNSNDQIILFLLKKGIDVNQADEEGFTALMWAIKKNCIQCVKELLSYNSTLEQQSNTGNNAIMLAASKHPKILELLLNDDSKLKVRNTYSLTALMIAVKSESLECVDLLLKHGANPKRKNNTGQDSFDLAENNQALRELLDSY